MATKKTGVDGAKQRQRLSFLISFKRPEARALNGREGYVRKKKKPTLNEQLPRTMLLNSFFALSHLISQA